jgi:hypothetical protein
MFQRSSLPFYSDITHQNKNRHWCEDANAAVLLTPVKTLLPFFFRTETAPTITAVKLVKNDIEYYDITSIMAFTNVIDAAIPVCYAYNPAISIANVTSPNITNSAGTSITPTYADLWGWLTTNAEWHIKMTVDGTAYFSDTFKFYDTAIQTTVNQCGVVDIYWSSTKDVGDIVYSNGSLSNKLYVNADEGRPSYSIIEESEEDSLKDKSVIFARSIKQYELQFLANESVCDSVSLIPLCDTVYIINQYGEARYVQDVEVEFDWQSDCIARVKMKYTTDRFVKKNC